MRHIFRQLRQSPDPSVVGATYHFSGQPFTIIGIAPPGFFGAKFAGSLVLAAVGLYGMTAYGVEQRTSEIGVRMALGANRAEVLAMVLREAFLNVGIGLALGIPAAIGAGYLISSQLFGVTPWDPTMLSAATLLLLMAALIAAIIPARRAASVDPMDALRTE